MTNEQDLPEPTRCYAEGCDRAKELLQHVADDPWLSGDFCMGHARAIIASTPLILACGCALCVRARRVVSSADDEPRLEAPGRWLVSTETSSYLLELDESGSGTVVRHVGEGLRFDFERPMTEPMLWIALGAALKSDDTLPRELLAATMTELPVRLT